MGMTKQEWKMGATVWAYCALIGGMGGWILGYVLDSVA